MQIASVMFTLRERYRLRGPDTALLWAHFAVYYMGLPLLLGPWQGLVFILVHRGLLGLFLGSVFAPNHKGMLVTNEKSNLDFLRAQVLTARNVRPSPLADFWYGGLNYQIEHHLFPSMPRNKLPEARLIVQRFCRARGVDYYETGVIRSNVEILQFLDGIGRSLRRRLASC